MADWIAIAKRTPAAGETVLAFWTPTSGAVHVGCFGVATMATPAHWHNPEDDEDDYIPPTHWMALPAAPAPSVPADHWITGAVASGKTLVTADDLAALSKQEQELKAAPADQPSPDKQGQQGERIEVGRLVFPAASDEYGDPEIDAFMGRIEAVQQRIQKTGARMELAVFVEVAASPAPTEEPRTDGGEVYGTISERAEHGKDRGLWKPDPKRHTTQCKHYDNNCGAVHPSNCPDCPFRAAAASGTDGATEEPIAPQSKQGAA